MAPQPTNAAERRAREQGLLGRLLALYAQERKVYGEVLELARRQGDIVSQGARIEEVRRLLERKTACLEAIRHMEGAEREAKTAWEAGRDEWSAAAQAHLHEALQEVRQLIEEILLCEEANDRHLFQLMRSD